MSTPIISQNLNTGQDVYQKNQKTEDSLQIQQNQANETIDQIRDRFEKQSQAENQKQESALDAQRLKGYEQIHKLKHSQQKELSKIRKQGDIDLSHLKNHYQNQIYTTEHQALEQIKELQSQSQRRLANEKKMSAYQEWEIRDKANERLRQIQDETQTQFAQQLNSKEKTLEQTKNRFEDESQKIQKQYNEKFSKTLSNSSQQINTLEKRTQEALETIREKMAENLRTYTSKQEDPFYKLIDLKAQLKEYEDRYVLTASVPQYEQEHLSASVKGDNLVLSGYRHNTEKQDYEDGHEKGTASFQSFHESFPLSWPVQATELSRHYEGETLIIQVPKKNKHAFNTPSGTKAGRIKIESPLPQDLVNPQQQSQSNQKETPVFPSEDRTLL